MSRARIIGAAAAIVVAIVCGFVYWNRDRGYDPGFDARVSDPAHRGEGPVVLFDEGHLNTHTTESGYKPLADLLRNDGYRVRVSGAPLNAPALQGVAVLVLAVARGANDANDAAAYTEAEAAAIDTYVRAGGALLLVTDHWPFGSAVASLARRFEIDMGAGLVEDAAHSDPDRGESHLVFSAENGLLRDHPIVRGRSAAERVRRAITFTGQSLAGPATAAPFLALSDSATERPPGPPRVERDGGDVRVAMEYGAPLPAAGRAQGLALEVGAGRVVALGEAGMLRAQVEGNGSRVGMNLPGYDNRQLALNILHWLSRDL